MNSSVRTGRKFKFHKKESLPEPMMRETEIDKQRKCLKKPIIESFCFCCSLSVGIMLIALILLSFDLAGIIKTAKNMSSDEENDIPEVDHLIMVIGIVVGVLALLGHFGLFIASCLMAVPDKHRGFLRIGLLWIFLALLGLVYKVFAAAYVSLPSETYEFVFTIVDEEIVGTAGLAIQWALTGIYILCFALGCVLVISQATALKNAKSSEIVEESIYDRLANLIKVQPKAPGVKLASIARPSISQPPIVRQMTHERVVINTHEQQNEHEIYEDDESTFSETVDGLDSCSEVSSVPVPNFKPPSVPCSIVSLRQLEQPTPAPPRSHPPSRPVSTFESLKGSVREESIHIPTRPPLSTEHEILLTEEAERIYGELRYPRSNTKASHTSNNTPSLKSWTSTSSGARSESRSKLNLKSRFKPVVEEIQKEHPQELAHFQNIRPLSRPASRQQNHEPRVTSDFHQSSDPLPPIRVVNCEHHDSRPTSRNGNKLAIIATPILDSEQTYYEGIPPMVCLGEVHLPVTTRNSYPEFHNLEAIRNIQ